MQALITFIKRGCKKGCHNKEQKCFGETLVVYENKSFTCSSLWIGQQQQKFHHSVMKMDARS